jgi:hypothetical protein
MNDQKQMHGFFLNSKDRMAMLIRDINGPDVIIANEALVMLGAYHGSHWRAIRYWAWKEIQRQASDMWFTAQLACYGAWYILRYGMNHADALQRAVETITGMPEPCTHEFAKTQGGGVIQCCQCGRSFTLEEYEAQKGSTHA